MPTSTGLGSLTPVCFFDSFSASSSTFLFLSAITLSFASAVSRLSRRATRSSLTVIRSTSSKVLPLTSPPSASSNKVSSSSTSSSSSLDLPNVISLGCTCFIFGSINRRVAFISLWDSRRPRPNSFSAISANRPCGVCSLMMISARPSSNIPSIVWRTANRPRSIHTVSL
ncbi:Uncharacterised protein [Mycobacteroides abscessus subsp. massiliense]|nr:Uncharacterised protein [Mycobacteroides abscessus subsp. massiliense]